MTILRDTPFRAVKILLIVLMGILLQVVYILHVLQNIQYIPVHMYVVHMYGYSISRYFRSKTIFRFGPFKVGENFHARA